MTIRKTGSHILAEFADTRSTASTARASVPSATRRDRCGVRETGAGRAAAADLQPLIDYSLELGASLTKVALAMLGASPAQLRAYTKAALVGIGGDLEHARRAHLGVAWNNDATASGRAAHRYTEPRMDHRGAHKRGSHLWAPRRGWDLDAFDSAQAGEGDRILLRRMGPEMALAL